MTKSQDICHQAALTRPDVILYSRTRRGSMLHLSISHTML